MCGRTDGRQRTDHGRGRSARRSPEPPDPAGPPRDVALRNGADRRRIRRSAPCTPRRTRSACDARRGAVDGAWWPATYDAGAELPALIAAIDQHLGRRVLRVGLHVDTWHNIPGQDVSCAGDRHVGPAQPPPQAAGAAAASAANGTSTNTQNATTAATGLRPSMIVPHRAVPDRRRLHPSKPCRHSSHRTAVSFCLLGLGPPAHTRWSHRWLGVPRGEGGMSSPSRRLMSRGE